MTVLACSLFSTASFGIYYMPTPTVTMQGVEQGNFPAVAIAIGATAWTAYDGAGTVVGTGTMLSSAMTITVINSGTWVGGSTVVPGFYTIATNSGTNLVCAGAFCVCTANSNLYVPSPTVADPTQVNAWLGHSPDRDSYGYNLTGSNIYQRGQTAAGIVANLQADNYFLGPQDSARPHHVWVSTGYQSDYPTQQPTPANWASLATALVAAGFTGAYYECPTNEPENGGWSISNIVIYWNECAAAILAVDATAHIMGYTTGGVYNDATIGNVATFLAGVTSPLAAFTNHMEASNQNLSNIVALRQYFGGIKTQFASSGVPNLDLWLTETGINGGGYGVLQPRRDARQRTVLRFVGESFGFSKEHSYDFSTFDHPASTLTTYMFDGIDFFAFNGGTPRGGVLALHVMGEALFGTTCSPTNTPASLSFGSSNPRFDFVTPGDQFFAGLHYTTSTLQTILGIANVGDRVVLATNGIDSATVTLATNATGNVTVVDGWGNPSTVAISGGQVTIPVNDLLTYVLFPAHGVTVSVVNTDQNAVTMSGIGLLNVAPAARIVNESSAVAAVAHGSFSHNNSGGPGASAPYLDATSAGTLTLTGYPNIGPIEGYCVLTPGNPWQGYGYGLLSVALSANGVQKDSWTCASAVSLAIPSGSGPHNDDQCTRTSWWTGAFAHLVALAPESGVTSIVVTIVGSFGGQPDAAASDNVTTNNLGTTPFPLNVAQGVQVAELQVYQLSGATLNGGTPSLARFGGV